MRESDLLEPNSYYAVAKCAQTLLCQHVARTEKRPITTLRLFSAYGPYEEPSRLVPTLIQRCLAGQDLSLVPPETARDFVYVDDVVDAYLCTGALAKLRGEIVNVGTGVQSTIRDLVEAIVDHTGARVEIRWGAMQAPHHGPHRQDAARGLRAVAGGGPRRPLLPRDGPRRPLHPLQGPRLHEPLRDAGRKGSPAGGDARDLRAGWQQARGASLSEGNSGHRGCHRLAGPRPLDRRRRGARAADGPAPGNDVRDAQRRRVQRGQHLGGGDVRCRPPTRQPRGHRRLQQAAGDGPLQRGHGAGPARGEVARVRLGHARDRRPRYGRRRRGPGERSFQGPAADRDRRSHGEGEGVSFMEDDLEWHYRPPNADDLARALAEIYGEQP